MARPRSEEKRKAILEAAVRVIATSGLAASTAAIAKEAGISNGSLFTYFETKSDLLNQLYLELKADMTTASKKGIRPTSDFRELLRQSWSNWMEWAVADPAKRRTLALLNVSDEILPATREQAQLLAAEFNQLLDRIRNHGSLKNVSSRYLGALMNALAEATMDAMLGDPQAADEHCSVGFEVFWRAIQ